MIRILEPRNFRTTLLAAALAAVLCAGTAAPSGAAGRGEQAQAPVAHPTESAATALSSAIEKTSQEQDYKDVYAGVYVDAEASRVTVFATDPARGRTLAERARREMAATDRDGVVVDVRAAKYSKAQLHRAADRIKAQAPAWGKSGAKLTGIVYDHEGKSLRVLVDDPQSAATLTGTPGVDGQSAEGAVGLGIDPADVHFETGGAIPASASRDSAVHWAGAWIDGPASCTSAFALDTPRDGRYVITAAHCGGIGSRWSSGPYDYGVVHNVAPDRDAAVIKPTGGAEAKVYTDEYNYSTYAGYDWALAGWEVCRSGRTLNYRCGIYVVDNAEWVLPDAPNTTVSGIIGCTRTSALAVAPGDSGGPVFIWRANRMVTSMGMISAGDYATAGIDPSTGASGWRCVRWVQTGDILRSWLADLVTG
ncbi:trypsin-like serine protease [Kitasatospora sp. NPDC059577]|uniref:trypsin-like serine protease n=1 Tax=Kitasatospora sp. NPDC059577 TaxID=3346873 RepID=UPI003677A263